MIKPNVSHNDNGEVLKVAQQNAMVFCKGSVGIDMHRQGRGQLHLHFTTVFSMRLYLLNE